MRLCERCNKPTHTNTCSYFNMQMICMACDARERKHPDFERAQKTEMAECLKGNLNFPGVGLPKDLK